VAAAALPVARHPEGLWRRIGQPAEDPVEHLR
jgi:hypothetical protein